MRITIRAARVNAGFKQSEAAQELGISKDTLRKYELNKIPMRIDTAKKISSLYGIPENNLIFYAN